MEENLFTVLIPKQVYIYVTSLYVDPVLKYKADLHFLLETQLYLKSPIFLRQFCFLNETNPSCSE